MGGIAPALAGSSSDTPLPPPAVIFRDLTLGLQQKIASLGSPRAKAVCWQKEAGVKELGAGGEGEKWEQFEGESLISNKKANWTHAILIFVAQTKSSHLLITFLECPELL